MKILMLTPYLPYPLLSGGQIRTYNLLKKLADKHEITLFALIKNDQKRRHIPHLEKFCKKVKVFKRSEKPFTVKNIVKTAFSSYPFLVMRNHVPEVIEAVKTELATEQYDLIHAETFYMMPHLPQTKIPIILVEQTIEYLGYESYAKKRWRPLRWLLNLDIAKIKHWEKFYWQLADKLVVMSDEDQAYIQRFVDEPDKVVVISNGVDTQWFKQKPQKLPSKPTILYVGTFKWLPNIEAVSFLVEKIWPQIKQTLPDAQLKIVGNAPTKEIKAYGAQDDSIEVTGRVEDIRDAFKQAHVLLAPVFSGKGTRYKILEAMASGTPIVATPTAVEGLKLSHGQQVLVGQDAQSLANLTLKVLNDPVLWKQLSQAGQAFVEQYYDWNLISQKLDKLYQSIG
jgi:glycosyltransferase involved in cell wall biosynthesis